MNDDIKSLPNGDFYVVRKKEPPPFLAPKPKNLGPIRSKSSKKTAA